MKFLFRQGPAGSLRRVPKVVFVGLIPGGSPETLPEGEGNPAKCGANCAECRHVSLESQLQPQPPAPQAQEPPPDGAVSLAGPLPLDLVCALKTESCSAPRLLEHLGQEADDLPLSTSRS